MSTPPGGPDKDRPSERRSLEAADSPRAGRARYPPGIPYIVGNEAAERFSFYGMRAILFVYMTALYLNFVPRDQADPTLVARAETRATQVVHLFNAGVYAFPMVGAILADRLLGKYPVIFWVSLLYCAGHALLALLGRFEYGMYAGLALIALGSGGIKPCVSANVGDQFSARNAHLVPGIYQIFYFSINFGSFFSTLLIPFLYERIGPEVAFGVPGILMGIATLVFWLGRNKFVKVPPRPGGRLGLLDFGAAIFLFLPFAVVAFGPEGHLLTKIGIACLSLFLWYLLFNLRQRIEPDAGFISVLAYTLAHQRLRRPGQGFFDVAARRFGSEAAEGPPAVLKIMLVFSMVSVFWALFDQHSSTWIKQAASMDLDLEVLAKPVAIGSWTIPAVISLSASQIPALNPLLVMILIPLLNLALFRPLEKRGVVIQPLQRMTAGMFITALAFVAAALLELRIEALAAEGAKVNVLWQVTQYVLLTTGEVLVSITGLEFAYTQAPRAMKSTIMGFWLLCVTVGNLLVKALAPLQELSLARFFWTFTGLMAAAAMVFAVLAYAYKGKTYLQEAETVRP